MDAIFTLQQIDAIAAELWQAGKEFKVWAFYANMGSGKTTLIAALAKLLQVQDAVSSPTFALIHQYQSPMANTLHHMDWYRLKDASEAIDAGIEDALYSQEYCFIEWPEKAPTLLPTPYFAIHLQAMNATERKIRTEIVK